MWRSIWSTAATALVVTVLIALDVIDHFARAQNQQKPLPKMSDLKLDGNRILVWLTNLLAVSAISFVAYFYVQFRTVESKVNAHEALIVELPNLRQREAAVEKEIAEVRAAGNMKLNMEEHLRYRDQMESQHIENLKTMGDLQNRISNLPKEFPPPPWFIAQFDDLRAETKRNGAKLDDINVRLARVETKLAIAKP